MATVTFIRLILLRFKRETHRLKHLSEFRHIRMRHLRQKIQPNGRQNAQYGSISGI